MDILDIGASRSYTKKSLVGLGALKGAPCTISNVQEDTKENIVTFKWTGTDGSSQTRDLKVKNGTSIVKVEINDDNTLTCTMSDGSVVKSSSTWTVEAENIGYTTDEDASVSDVKGALDKLMTKTDSVLTEDFTANVAMGNITVGKRFPKGTQLEDIIVDMLTQYIKPTVNLILNPSKTLYDEVEESITSITLSAVVTKNTSNIKKVEFYVNGTVVNTVTANVINGGTFPYIYNPSTPIKADTSFKVVVTDVNDGTGTASKDVAFIAKSYYGIVSADVSEPNASNIKVLNNTLKNAKKYVYSEITTDWGKVCYAYPSELGALTSIKDEVNNINYTGSFNKTITTVDGVEYFVYTQIDPSASENVTLTFS